MHNLSEVCLVGLGLRGKYVRCLVISMRLRGAKTCGGGFKVIILTGQGKGGSQKEGTSFYGGS